MRTFLTSITAVLLSSALALPAASHPVSAPPQASVAMDVSSNLVLAKHKKHVFKKKRGKAWKYHRKYHGDRRRHRDNRFRFLFNGFYYSSPYWSNYDDGGFYYGDVYYDDGYYDGGYNSDAHVRWCLNRYRSYDVRTDTFMGYDGRRHGCNSPYD